MRVSTSAAPLRSGAGWNPRALVIGALLGLLAAGPATAELVSHTAAAASATGNGWSQPVALTPDGRFVLFTSAASDLVAGVTDANGNDDVFVVDRQAPATELVSHAAGSPTTTANGGSRAVALTPDGRFVLLKSPATDLVVGVADTNGAQDVFVYDRQTRTTELVSHAAGSLTTTANGSSESVALSADGRFVLYQSTATNLVAGQADSNGAGYDAFVYDRQTQTTELVSRAASSSIATGNGASQPVALSMDGRFVLLRSVATNLVSGATDANASWDVFVYDRQTQAMELVSHAASPPTATGNGRSLPIAFTPDGRFVLVQSLATNLVSGETDGNGGSDVLVYDRQTGTMELVSHAVGSPTMAGGNWSSTPAALTPDGRFVVFASAAADLVTGMTDANGIAYDAFLYDRQAQTMELLSHATGGPTTTANSSSEPVAVGADGRFVLLASAATNLATGLADGNADFDVFLLDRQTHTTTLASHGSASATTSGDAFSYPVALTSDGQSAIFYSDASDLAATDANGTRDAFLWRSGGGPPSDPTIVSTVPPPATWSRLAAIQVSWSGASDRSGAGLAGYSVVFDHLPTTAPDRLVDVAQSSDPHATSAAALADGGDWYFHLSTCDNLGQCTSTVHAGPFWLDSTPPSAPGAVASSSHGDGQAHLTPVVQIEWPAASDNLSGVVGYWHGFDGNPTAACGATSLGGATTASSAPLGAGTWYAHVCAVDVAGNWGAVVNGGPYVIARPGSLWYFTLTPCRLVDTRLAAGWLGGPAIGGAAARVFPLVASRCGIPTEARALSVNLTVAGPEAAGFLTLYRGDAERPGVSALSFGPGDVRASNAITQVSGDGNLSVAVYNGSAGLADVVIDVNGYFAPWP